MTQFEQLVEQAPDGVVVLEAGRVVFINATAARLLGVTRAAAIGEPIARFLPPADAALAGERIGRMMATGEDSPAKEYGVLADPDRVVEIKSMRWQWQGQPAVLAFARDVTERKAVQQHLVHADRLAAVGTLAAGVAHEINNPLTYVRLSLQLVEAALERVPGASELVANYLREANQGIERVAAITRSLRMFARPDEAAPGPVDPIAVVERALKMVDNDLRHRARLVRELGEVPWVVANASRLEQVIVNLLLNAIQALRGTADDTITVAVATLGTGEVAIRVQDNGIGIPPEALERVFDPFFTTKKVGEGMGLGLAVSRSIVESIGGRIALDSREHEGTSATVMLRAHVAAVAVANEPRRTAAGPRLRVLVVDDEPAVRNLLGQLLATHHEVTTVDSGHAAVAAASEGGFDVVLCDIMMPGMTGADVYQHLARSRPGLERRIVFVTGGAFVGSVASFVSSTGNRVLEKPFKLADALAAIAATAQN